MKPVRIISSEFELLAEIDDYESLVFTRNFFGIGDFELHININKNNTDKLRIGNLIMIGASRHKAGIIKHCEIRLTDGKATEELLIKGSTLKGVLSQRVTVPPNSTGYDRIKGKAETVMKHYVANNCISPANPKRSIPQLTNAPDSARGTETAWQTRYEKLDEVITQIAEYCDLGWEIWLDTSKGKWIFDVVEGRNLSANQDRLPPAIFSTEFDNIKSQCYIDSCLNYKNVGYAGGKGEEENRLIQQIGEVEGLARNEVFLDCSNSEDINELLTNGQKRLSEFKKIQSFEADIINVNSFTYEQDWELGDIVTVQNKKWDITIDVRIIEVKEIYETNGFNLEVMFGNEAPSLISKFKKETKRIVK